MQTNSQSNDSPFSVILRNNGKSLKGNQVVQKQAAYIGSFPVDGEDQRARAECVRQKLENMRVVRSSKPIVLAISLSGIKMCSDNMEIVYMAHALRRISYATCDPEFCQFSFLAREPKGQVSVQYCHAFITKTPEQAEELNNIVGDAFKTAFSLQQRSTNKASNSVNNAADHEVSSSNQSGRTSHQQKSRHSGPPPPPPIRQGSMMSGFPATPAATPSEQTPDSGLPSTLETVWVKQQDSKQSNHSRSNHSGDLMSPQSDYQSDSQSSMSAPPPPLPAPRNRSKSFASSNHYGDLSQTQSRAGPGLHPQLSSDPAHNNIAGSRSGNFISPVVALKERLDQGQVVIPAAYHSPHQSTHIHKALPDPPSAGEAANTGHQSAFTPPRPDNHHTYNCPPPPTPPRQTSPTNTQDATPPRFYCNTKQSQSSNEGKEPMPLPPKRFDSLRLKYDVAATFSEADSGTGTGSGAGHNEHGGHPPGFDTAGSSGSGHTQPSSSMTLSDEAAHTPLWYQANIPREIALEILAHEEVGGFVVRDSTSHPGCYALSVKVPKFDNPSGITHYLIQRTARGGVKLKGLDKEWPTLQSIVVHLTVMPEMLPCALRLPRAANNPAFMREDNPGDSELEDQDYQRLSDFSCVLANFRLDV